jgi:hypothetical protein
MRLPSTDGVLCSFIALLAILCLVSPNASSQSSPETDNKGQGCPNDDSGLTLPPGFCATVFADEIGHARHIVVAPSGVLYGPAPHRAGRARESAPAYGQGEPSPRHQTAIRAPGDTGQDGGHDQGQSTSPRQPRKRNDQQDLQAEKVKRCECGRTPRILIAASAKPSRNCAVCDGFRGRNPKPREDNGACRKVMDAKVQNFPASRAIAKAFFTCAG